LPSRDVGIFKLQKVEENLLFLVAQKTRKNECIKKKFNKNRTDFDA
jgi:hypothetical protein